MPQMSHKHLLVPYFPQNIITESYRMEFLGANAVKPALVGRTGNQAFPC